MESQRRNRTHNGRSILIQGHSKVVDFGTKRKRICDFLLVINSNLGFILHRFGDTVVYWSKIAKIASSYPPQSHKSPGLARSDLFRISQWTRYFQKLECSGSPTLKKSWHKLSSYWYNTGVWQTDGKTDGQTDTRGRVRAGPSFQLWTLSTRIANLLCMTLVNVVM